LKTATQRIEALEVYTRRDNLLISGLPVESFADAATAAASTGANESSAATEQTVLKLFSQQLEVPIQSSDISVTHRLPKRSSSEIPTTIVKFTNRKARDMVYNARRKLKGRNIFINEDFSKSTADLFRHARNLVKAKIIHSAWTSGCNLLVKTMSDQNCKPKKITLLSDLPVLPNFQ
jgi:hypothetical protein